MNGISISLCAVLCVYICMPCFTWFSLEALELGDRVCLILLPWTQLRFKGTNLSKDIRAGDGEADASVASWWTWNKKQQKNKKTDGAQESVAPDTRVLHQVQI